MGLLKFADDSGVSNEAKLLAGGLIGSGAGAVGLESVTDRRTRKAIDDAKAVEAGVQKKIDRLTERLDPFNHYGRKVEAKQKRIFNGYIKDKPGITLEDSERALNRLRELIDKRLNAHKNGLDKLYRKMKEASDARIIAETKREFDLPLARSRGALLGFGLGAGATFGASKLLNRLKREN